MATSFQPCIDRENIENSVSKATTGRNTGQRGLSTKPSKSFNLQTPRKAFQDLGNIKASTAKNFQTPKPQSLARKIQTPKPSKLKIFEETPKAKSSTKSKKGTFSVLNTHKTHSKIPSDTKIKKNSEENSSLPEIEKMAPFVDKENDIPRSENITKLLNHHGLLNPLLLVPPQTHQDDFEIPTLHHELEEPFPAPTFDDTIASIIGYDEKPELVDVDSHFALDFLPPLDDIDLPLM